MTEIGENDIDSDHWATSDQVRERIQLEFGNKDPDFENRIQNATDSVQADWAEATGKPVPEELPDDPHSLLQAAVADLAASDAHMNFAKNISNDNDGDERHVFLESRSERNFEKWKKTADLEPDSERGDSGVGSINGRTSSMTSDIIERDRRSPGEGW